MKTIVIGGGPAGMMAAISSAKHGDTVTLLEKNNSLGKKLLITGKGRCNITSSLDMDEFIANVPGNGKFLFSCFQNFTNNDIIEMLKKHGLEVKNERGNRIFPVTDKSQDVLNCFIQELKEQNVNIKTNSEVVEIGSKNGEVTGVYFASRRIFFI
jgi:predicted Rossmann fold flavoprotein